MDKPQHLGPMTTAQDLDYAKSPQNANPPSAAKKRTRRTHPKVRTGCITCKIRRKKCDETKPECWRCISTGRKCDGYARSNNDIIVLPDASKSTDTDVREQRVPKGRSVHAVPYNDGCRSDSLLSPITGPGNTDIFTSSSSQSFATPSTYSYHNRRQRRYSDPDGLTIDLIRAPNVFPSTHTITDLENHCFSYFRYHTGPQLTSYFSSTIWQKYCTSIGLSHPVVFACAAAVGAVHRRFNMGISAEALQWCAHSDHLVRNARRLLTAFERNARTRGLLLDPSSPTSDHGLNMGSSGHGVDDSDILMTAHMLLFHFESFQADFAAAVFDLKVGIKHLLLRPMRLIYSQTSYPSLPNSPEVLIKFFEKLKVRARELFRSEEEILTPTGNHLYGELPPVPVTFSSLDQARDYMFTEVYWILHTPDRIWSSKASRLTARSLHMNRILKWSAAYAEVILRMDSTEIEKRIGCLLRLTRSLAYLLLYFALHLTAQSPGHIEENRNGLVEADAVARHIETKASSSEHKLDGDPQSDDEGMNRQKAHQSNALQATASHLWKTASQREDLMSTFYRLQIWADMLLNPISPFRHFEHSVSFDSGVGLPLAPPLPQSSGKTRFKVKYVMERSEEMLEATDVSGQLGIYGLAEQSSAIEEHAVLEVVQSKLPSGTTLEWVDLTLFVEERRILLQYCCSGPDVLDRSLRWMQEWWIF